MNIPKLTSLTKSSGCGCKINPAALQEILSNVKSNTTDINLLVGNKTNDDAAVYAINDTQALVSTVDFFTPIVNDAYLFGKIAAANAISDVYAMGAKPILALGILAWPMDILPPTEASKVMQGAADICAAEGIALAGGHSIDIPIPLFGLTVQGIIDKQKVKTNSGALEGDVLLLTKPLGTGILAAAHKREKITEADEAIWIKYITQVNSIGMQLQNNNAVHALTDVTGFGLLGHCIEMAKAAQLSIQLNYNELPIMNVAKTYLQQGIVPDAVYKNWNSYNTLTQIMPSVNMMEAFNILCDPQTNGGLLIACDAVYANELLAFLHANNIT
jgi:selenide, water dikinase